MTVAASTPFNANPYKVGSCVAQQKCSGTSTWDVPSSTLQQPSWSIWACDVATDDAERWAAFNPERMRWSSTACVLPITPHTTGTTTTASAVARPPSSSEMLPPSSPTNSANSATSSVGAPEPLSTAAMQLKAIVVALLEDAVVNPFRGSLPIEKVQNLLRREHDDLYTAVVGAKHRAWNRFLEAQGDVVRMVCMEDGKWRVYLATNPDYLQGDEEEKRAKGSEEARLLQAIVQCLEEAEGHSCSVDHFIAAYDTLPMNLAAPRAVQPLPKRGDLVRFVKRHTEVVAFDQPSFTIRLL